MAAGVYVAGIVLAMMAEECFSMGGFWIIGGVVSVVGAIVLGATLYKQDMEDHKH